MFTTRHVIDSGEDQFSSNVQFARGDPCTPWARRFRKSLISPPNITSLIGELVEYLLEPVGPCADPIGSSEIL